MLGLFLDPNQLILTVSSSVAVVILNWNGLHFLEKFLPHLLASSYPDVEWVVADNGSTDQSIKWMEENFPEIRIIRLDQNYGFAGGYNRALEQVNSKYYILLNSDVEVSPGWIEPLFNLMESDPEIGACQPKMLEYAHRNRFEYAGACGGWIDSFGYPFCRGRVFDHCEEDRGQYDETAQIFWASGAAICLRSELFHALGGFDEFFFAHQEEIELCWRMQLSGFKILACPASVIYHVGGGTLPKSNPRKVFLNFRNNLVMISRYFSWKQRLFRIPVRILLDIASAWKNLLGGDAGFFRAVCKAHLAYLAWIFSSKKNRPPVLRKGLPKGIYKGNIAWQYFVRHRKTFFEITRRHK